MVLEGSTKRSNLVEVTDDVAVDVDVWELVAVAEDVPAKCASAPKPVHAHEPEPATTKACRHGPWHIFKLDLSRPPPLQVAQMVTPLITHCSTSRC